MDEDKNIIEESAVKTEVKTDENDKKKSERHFVGKKPSPFRKKVCRLCARDAALPDYKNPESLKKWTTDRGKILPSRITGTCAKHQRMVAAEIKKARNLALLPFDRK